MLTVVKAPEHEQEPSPLREHLAATYFTLRLGLGVIAVAFPLVLAVGGRLYAGLPLQDSMSAYYHATGDDGRSMRTWFVGILFALGALLYLYKGFSDRENVVLNVAGVMVVLVAVFPMSWGCGDACPTFTIHGTSAVLAFLAIFYVAMFTANDTLKLVRDPTRRRRLGTTYRLLAGVLLVSPVAAFFMSSVAGMESALVFFVEAFGIVAFAAYWVVKGAEIRQTHADIMALDGTMVETEEHLVGGVGTSGATADATTGAHSSL